MIHSALYKNSWTDAENADADKLPGPIIIFGASGFIGANLFFALKQRRNDVFACSRNVDRSWRLAGMDPSSLIACDITKIEEVKQIVNNIRPQTVFNLSAYGGYARQNDPDKIHATNYFGTLNLLRALSEIGSASFVQAGSSSEYGLNCLNSDETFELIPNSDYAVSKVGAGHLVKYFGRIHGYPCLNLRMYSVYGPWEERDRLIPNLIRYGLEGKYTNFANKDISRDFVYIDDCTHALVRAALYGCMAIPGSSVNICTGVKTTLEDISAVAQKVFGIKDRPKFGTMANRKWDLADWYGNPAFAKIHLKWASRHTFEEGLRKTVQWEKEAIQKLKYVSVPVKSKKISVILACYKDEEAIPVMFERLTKVFREASYDYELIFVNDCSPAKDEAAIYQLCLKDSHVIGISHSRNFGSQSAFISGMEIAKGDAVIVMDGDGQDPPELIPEFIAKWEEGYEVVYGTREKRKAPLHMQLFYKAFYRLFRKISNIDIPLDAGDFSLIDKKAFGYLLKFPERDIFLRGLRAWIGFKQTGVPYTRPERLFGKSTNSLFRNFWWAKKGIFSFSTKPLQFIQTLGMIMFATTFLLSIFYLINYFINPPEGARGIPTVIFLILGLGGIQLISISILGDYIGKIIEEVKSRPKFIRTKIFFNGIEYSELEDYKKINSSADKK
jgi:nucleoside-diphosphate-sugar epimerase/glycosyltransferase involved in cell wall biosynthesis